jgi:hypothetical protein
LLTNVVEDTVNGAVPVATVLVTVLKLGVLEMLRVPPDRLNGKLTAVIGSVSAKEPLERVIPEPMAVIG